MDNMNNTNTGNNAVDSSRHTQEIVLDKNRNGLPVMIAVIAAYAAAVVLLFGRFCGSALAGSCFWD